MSFEELLPLLIGAGYLIIRAMNASNKKKQEAVNQRRATPSVPEVDSPYVYETAEEEQDPRRILMEMLGMEREQPARPEIIIEPVLDLPASDENMEEQQLYTNYNLPSVEKVDTLQSAKILDEMRKEAMKGEFKEIEKERSFWDEEAFDLRKAVIYSEILRPKFAD